MNGTLNKQTEKCKSSEGFWGARGPDAFQVKKQMPEPIPKRSHMPNGAYETGVVAWASYRGESISVRLLCPETGGGWFCPQSRAHWGPFSVAIKWQHG